MAVTTTTTMGTADIGQAQVFVNRRRKPWRKNPIVIGCVALLVIIIGLAVGLGVGLPRNKGDDSDNSNDSGNSNPTSNTRPELWKPKAGVSWQIVLQQPIKLDTTSKAIIEPDVDVYDLDLYEGDVETFKALQDKGKRVICYFSAGSYENYRGDKDDFDDADLGKQLDGWPDERWLNLSSSSVRDIMKKRIKMAADKGCDAIDPDNVDGYVSLNSPIQKHSPKPTNPNIP